MALIQPSTRAYLLALGALCREAAGRPSLLVLFIEIILLVPTTLARLRKDTRRLAA